MCFTYLPPPPQKKEQKTPKKPPTTLKSQKVWKPVTKTQKQTTKYNIKKYNEAWNNLKYVRNNKKKKHVI